MLELGEAIAALNVRRGQTQLYPGRMNRWKEQFDVVADLAGKLAEAEKAILDDIEIKVSVAYEESFSTIGGIYPTKEVMSPTTGVFKQMAQEILSCPPAGS